MPQVDLSAALDLRINKRLSYEQIGKIQGVSKQAVHRRLKLLLPDDGTKAWQVSKADILSHLQLVLLSQVDERRLKKLNARDAVVSAGILFDKEQLVRGLPTEIDGVIYVDLIEALRMSRGDR